MNQCKDSSNNLKSIMVTPEPSGHVTGRLDHSNAEEAEENDFKHNFMKMMEIFKKEMKNSLKEMQERP